jgi:hypothetical protein
LITDFGLKNGILSFSQIGKKTLIHHADQDRKYKNHKIKRYFDESFGVLIANCHFGGML